MNNLKKILTPPFDRPRVGLCVWCSKCTNS